MAHYVLVDHGNDRKNAHVVSCSASTNLDGMLDWRDRMNRVYEEEDQGPRRCRLYKLVPVEGEDVSDILETENKRVPPKPEPELEVVAEEEPQPEAKKVRTFRRRLK